MTNRVPRVYRKWIVRLAKAGETQARLARIFGVSLRQVRRLLEAAK